MLAINNIDIIQDYGGGIQSGNFNIIAACSRQILIAIPISLVVTGKRTFSATATEQPSHYYAKV